MAKKKYLEESERKLIESVNNAYIPTDWDEFEKRYHKMERYGDGKPRRVDKEKMEYIEDGLVSRGIGGNQLSSLLSTIVEESGGNPFSVDDSGKFRGLIQFSKERYPEKDFDRDKKAGWKKAVDNQLDTIVDHLNEYGGDYGFLDGGDGSGYMTGEEAKDAFWGRDSDIENVTRALTYGFVRPGDRSGTTENRTRVARLINEIIQPPVEVPDILEFDYDGKHYKATKPEEVTPEMRRALMLSKLVGEKNKVELQDSLYTTFNEAYGRAKGKGARVFMWNGRKYSTKEEGGEVKDMERFGKVLESLYNEDVERVRNGERAQYFGVLNDKPLKNVYPEFDFISKPANMVYKGADMIANPISKVASSGASGFLEKELAGPVYWTKKLGDFMKALYLGATRPIFNSLPESAKPLARQVFKHLYQWRHFTLPDTVRLSRELFGGEDEPESFDAAFKAAREQGLDTFEWNGNEYSTEMKEEGGETNAAEFSLPEINIYPNNRFGDIARSQGLKTARQWMEVRNATTNGINDFVNDPRTQFILGMLPLPMGAEGVEEISNLIKKAKDFRQISKDLRITPWMEQQLIDDAVEKANWRILEDEGALGQGRLITQQDRPSVELTLKSKSQKNSGEYAAGRKFINNKLWWSHRKPFYWGATRDGSKRILYSIDGNNVDLVRAKDLDPEYPNSWVYLTDEVVLTNPKLNTKFFVPTEGGYFIPSSHYRFTQWKDDMMDMMNTVKPEEWVEFRDGGWTKEDENDFQKWYAKIAEHKGLNPDPDDENQYYDYRTYWLENPEAARKMLEDDPEAHFTDRYKYPGHPTFSDESMYADEEHPGGHWETVDGVGYYVPSEYTKSYIDRTIEYLAGQNEGVYVDGEYKLIPKMPDGGLSRLAPRDNTSVGHPGKSEDINRNLGVHKNPIDFTELAASFVPVVGDVMDVRDFIRAREEGDNVGMLLASLGFLPIVGGMASAANKARRAARLTSHLQGEDAVKMFKEYGRTDIPENSELAKQLKLYLPDIRNRYGLVGNDDISDDDIIGSIYKHVVELSGDSKNLNDMGEPQILFRGDTKRYDELMDRITPEDLVEGTGTMDNSLGNLFLDRIPEEGSREGIDRYLNTVNADKWGSIELSPSATGSGIVSNKGNVYKDSQRVKKLPSDVVFLYKRGDGTDIYRMPVKFSNDGANDINGFIVRTGDVRDATREIAIDDNYALTSDAFDLHAKRPTTDEEGFVVDESTMRAFDNIEDEKAYVRRKMAEHYSNLLKDAETNNQGLLRSGYFVDERGRRFNPFRGEHTDYNYYALPNFNKQNAKHVLPYDLRVPTDWSDANIYRKEGGPSDLAPRDNTSVGRPGPADVQPVKPSAAARENPVVPFVAKKYWDGFGKDGKDDIESGVFDEHRWVVKRIGNEEFYTNSPLLKTLPSMSREDVALSLLPPELWPGVLKRKEDVTGKSARRHFIRGGEVSELQDYIYDRLTKEHGIAPIQAIGIVANLTQESALDYDALGDNGRSYGIQQWQGDRRKNLFEFAKERGRDKPALDDQVDFLVEEYKSDGFLFPTRGENMYKTGKTDKDMFDYFQYSKLDFDNAANIYDSTRAWAQGFGRGNKNFLNMDKRFHIAKTLSSRYNIDAGGQSFYTDMGYKDEWGSPIPEVAVSAEKKVAQDDWMEKYGNKMLASILAGDGEGGDTHVTNNYYVNEEGLSEDERRNAAEVRELQQKQQAQELLASIIDGIKLDIKGVTEVRKR